MIPWPFTSKGIECIFFNPCIPAIVVKAAFSKVGLCLGLLAHHHQKFNPIPSQLIAFAAIMVWDYGIIMVTPLSDALYSRHNSGVGDLDNDWDDSPISGANDLQIPLILLHKGIMCMCHETQLSNLPPACTLALLQLCPHLITGLLRSCSLNHLH